MDWKKLALGSALIGAVASGCSTPAPSGPVCMNMICEAGETAASCRADCDLPGPAVCGDSFCEAPETATNCEADCGSETECGNGVCEIGETMASCAGDCTAMAESQAYIVNTVQIPQSVGTEAVGFNLDGRNTTMANMMAPDCRDRIQDFTSSIDTGEVGVDNALSQLIPVLAGLVGDLDMTLAQTLRDGSLLLLVQVSGIDSYTNDEEVQVRLHLGMVPAGGMLMLMGPMGSEIIASGQTFTTMPLGMQVTGRIQGGRLRASAELLMLNISASGMDIMLPIRNAQVRGDITADTMTNGVIGGSLNVEEVADIAEAIMKGIRDTALEILRPYADLEPSAADQTMCESLSVGIQFNAVDATISGG